MTSSYVRLAMALALCACALARADQDLSQTNTTHIDDVNCSVDDDGRHEVLDKCLKLGGRFIKKYKKALGQGDEKFDVCEASEKFMSCIEPLTARCPGMKHVMHNHWRNVTAYIKCACHDKTTECTEGLHCLAAEYGSFLVGRCNSLFNFNIRQNTRDECHFLREAINCKDALITSQCGGATGEFAYHLLRLSHDDFVVKNRCHLPRTPTYKGFRYTDNDDQCRHFLRDMKSCVQENISRKQMLDFREDNDLVVEDKYSKKEIKEACSRYRKFNHCMKPIRERCPAGPELVYEVDPELRQYRLKMDYICKTAKKNYLQNIRCYNRIHMDGTIKQCNEHVWDDVATYLDNVTSYQIYCQQELPTVKALRQELDKVRLCYEEVVSNECNRTASETLSEFMKLVFRDPEYLKLGFVADCELHRSAPPIGSTAGSTLHYRHEASDPGHGRATPRMTTSAQTKPARNGAELKTDSPWTPAPSVERKTDKFTSGSVTIRCSALAVLVTFASTIFVRVT